MKKYFLIIIAMAVSSWLYADIVNVTPRNYGLEYGNSAIVSGADGVFVNSSSLPYNSFHEFYAGYSRLYLGLDNDDLSQSYFLYSTPNFMNFAFGAGFIQFSASKYAESKISIASSYRINFSQKFSMSLGVTPHLNIVKYKDYGDDPLFAREGDTKSSFGLDGGLTVNWGNLYIGGNYENIVKPSIALDDTVSSGELPYSITGAISYNFSKIGLTPFVSFYIQEDDIEEDIRIAGGLEYLLFDGLIAARASFSDKDVNFGIGIRPKLSKPVSFDYLFANRKLDVNFANHHLGLGLRLPHTKKIRKKPNIRIELVSSGNSVISHLDTFSVSYRIVHDDVLINDDFYVNIRVGNSMNISDSFKISFEKDTMVYTYSFEPSEIGDYDISISVDRNNEIDETNERDNAIGLSFVSVGDLIAQIEPTYNELEINRITYISEEEPFIPIVFFEPSSNEIPERFHNTLDILSDRLKKNPDVIMQLHGYVDGKTDTVLSVAKERSNKVRDYLLSKGVPKQQIDMVSVDKYDIEKPRLEEKSVRVTKEEIGWISEENRRVELSPVIGGRRELESRWDIGMHTDGISGFVQQYHDLICMNSDVTVQLEWFIDADFAKTYKDIDALRDFIRLMINTECETETEVPIILTKGEKGQIGLSLSAEKMIYSPVEHALSAKDFTIPSDKKINRIRTNINSPEAVVNHIMVVYNTDTGAPVRRLSTGTGAPKDVVSWDWRDNNGNLLDPKHKYVVKLGLVDIVGNTTTFVSDTMSIIPTESMHRLTSSIIIQFMFDEISSTSRFLESRVDNFARQIIEVAENNRLNGAAIKIIGHTDPIGADTRNFELSAQRAQKEYTSLTNHLVAILDLESIEELNAWLEERNVKLEVKGVADTEPYLIERYKDNKFETIRLGDNTYPEGRSINRRVIIEIDENLKGEGK